VSIVARARAAGVPASLCKKHSDKLVPYSYVFDCISNFRQLPLLEQQQ
jgi:hypothetical protein